MILDKPILNDNCNSALAEMWLRSLNELEHDDADISLPSIPSLPEVVTASMATPPGPRPPPQAYEAVDDDCCADGRYAFIAAALRKIDGPEEGGEVVSA